jgi:hypothetical protein
MLGFAVILILAGIRPAVADSTNDQVAAITKEMNFAIWRVQDIVNQTVTPLPRTPDMQVAAYPGWFHPGAITPDFNTVDVRQSQDFFYDSHEYVSSDLNPGVVFRGHDLEFNAMTKYFITDRTVPKKRLTEDEMLEINRLYRQIGRCQQRVVDLQHPGWEQEAQLALEQSQPSRLIKIQQYVTNHRSLVVAWLVLLIVAVMFARIFTNKNRAL